MLNKINRSTFYLLNDDSLERPALGVVCGDKYSLVIDPGNSVQHAHDFCGRFNCSIYLQSNT